MALNSTGLLERVWSGRGWGWGGAESQGLIVPGAITQIGKMFPVPKYRHAEFMFKHARTHTHIHTQEIILHTQLFSTQSHTKYPHPGPQLPSGRISAKSMGTPPFSTVFLCGSAFQLVSVLPVQKHICICVLTRTGYHAWTHRWD